MYTIVLIIFSDIQAINKIENDIEDFSKVNNSNMLLLCDYIEDYERETARPNTKQSLPLIQDNSTRSSVLSGLIENEHQQPQEQESIINEENIMFGNDSVFNENDYNISYGEDSIIRPEEYIGNIISDVPVIMPTKRVSPNAVEIVPKKLKSIFDKKTELASIYKHIIILYIYIYI